MKKNIFAVCDLEVDYALNFMDYLNHKKNIPFEIQAFTNVESLIAYGKMNHIELLLISQKAMCRQVQELEIGKIVILSELLYFVRQENGNLIYKMNSMVQTINNLDFIPPVRTPEDIRGTAWEDWEKLIQEIVLHSNYEFVILDIGGAVDGTFQVLDMCRRIYMPVLSDPVSISKIAQFENLIRIWDYPQILTRTVKVRPPFHGGNVAPENYIEGLLWSELGDYVREILRKEKE